MATDPESLVEPVHDVLRRTSHPLDAFFRPTTLAIVGASQRPGSVGTSLVKNLTAPHPQRQVFLVNGAHKTLCGQVCYSRVTEVPAPIDLAVIAVPAASVPAVIDDCLAAQVRGAIVISSGFREIGPAGVALEERLRNQIRGTNLRLIGPNCLGVMSSASALNATFASELCPAGNLGLISQSGAILTAILDWSRGERVGFSHVVSIGSMLDVAWGDLIDYLGDDPATHAILLYMESIGDARSFLSAAREVAWRKPIIAIKAGRTQQAAQAAASHTGAMVGSDQALDAAFRRAGVLRVMHISALFELAEVLAKQPLPRGPHLAILTNAGGPGVLATDRLIEVGGKLSVLSHNTVATLDQMLPPHWSHANPVDVLGDTDPARFAHCAEVLLSAPESDGLLAILTPQAMTDPTATAQQLAACSQAATKPVIASWMGGRRMQEGIEVLNQAGIPTLPYPDAAARMFQYTWQHHQNLQGLYEVPSLTDLGEFAPAREHTTVLLDNVLAQGRTLLTEVESKQVLAVNGFATVETRLARTTDEAVAQAQSLGYPVVLKVHSTKLTHKACVGGVRLNLTTGASVATAFGEIAQAVGVAAGAESFEGVTVQPMITATGYELILGCSIDSQLGPVILFGAGGGNVALFHDTALGLPPLTSTLARRLMERTKIYSALRGKQSTKIDVDELEQLLVRFASLVLAYPRIREIDINPLLVHAGGWLALDARMVLHPASVTDSALPRPAIRPYPQQYVSNFRGRGGREFVVRPIRPEDEPLLARFHETLSDHTVYARYAQVLSLSRRTIHDRLARLCFIDYDRQMALVAMDCSAEEPRIVAVGRLIRLEGQNAAEFALVVSDSHQRQGLGRYLLEQLVEIGRDEALELIVGYIQATNRGMLSICRRLGFQSNSDGSTQIVTLQLR